MKKFIILGVLFLLPIVAYLFFASGVNNFVKLPVLTTDIKDTSHLNSPEEPSVTLQDQISVVAFFGNDLEALKGNTFNLDRKILSTFYEFKDFQFVIILPEEARQETNQFVEEFKGITNSDYWKFVYGNENEVREIFASLETNISLDSKLHTPYVFIVDKDRNLRGRTDDEDKGILYGYDSRSVSELNNKMEDDVKVLLAEYRLALKKNNNSREKAL